VTEDRYERFQRMSKALGIRLLTGETFIGLGQYADYSVQFKDSSRLFVEYERTQHHPAANVLKYWPHLESNRSERAFLLHVFALDAGKLVGPRSDLTDWIAARMVRSFRGRFSYLRIRDEPAGLRSARAAIRDWSQPRHQDLRRAGEAVERT
jgi:hypothetical protein